MSARKARKKGAKSAGVVGIVSDTHGLLRPEALAALRGADMILHAGDVGDPTILDALRALAPVVAVRGNNDRAPFAFTLPETKRIDAFGARLFLLHDVKELPFEPADEPVDVVVYGHSHRPEAVRRDGVLWVNPGSAGPRRFNLPVTVARLMLGAGEPRADIVTLDVPPAR